MQVFDEHGWIDLSKICKYTSKCQEGPDGVAYSINLLMEQQEDFMVETTLLQYHVAKLGATIEQSPKYYPEIVGEGVEYGWVLAKIDYSQLPISEKKSRDSFLKLIQKCTNNTRTILNLERMRACSRQSHHCMALHKAVGSID